jgi:pyridoxal 5'-phosphate synthase pdxS subunit
MIRSKGEAGTGNVVEAVRHLRTINAQMRRLQSADASELFSLAKDLQAPLALVQEVAATGRCRCRCSAPGASPPRPTRRWCCSWAPRRSSSGSGIFKSEDPVRMAAPSSRPPPTSRAGRRRQGLDRD